MARRSQFGSLAVSLALHAGLIGLAAGVIYGVAPPRAAIPVALLPGGGGGAGNEVVAPAAPAPQPAPEVRVEEKKPPRPAIARKQPARPEAPAAAAVARNSVVEAPVATVGGGEGTGSGPGGASGSGGGTGAGAGDVVGAGKGSGRAVDLRLYCVSCPEPPYPRLARARGWQGATDVELTVLADGRVDEAMVARSSGFDVLDRAALDVARQSRFSPPAESVSPPVRGKLAYRFELRRR